MRVGIPRETTQGERRVALVPETIGKLAAAGFELVVESGAGDAASFPDDAYSEAGATLGDPWEADGVVKVRKPSPDERERLHSGQLLIAFLEPLSDQAGVEALAGRGVTAFALESVPRITRAQAMDALSSQATVGGYKAALLPDAHHRRRHGAAREGARDRRRSCGAAGDRHGPQARRGDHRFRRPSRRARADREPWRELAGPRRDGRRGRGRLRARADR